FIYHSVGLPFICHGLPILVSPPPFPTRRSSDLEHPAHEEGDHRTAFSAAFVRVLLSPVDVLQHQPLDGRVRPHAGQLAVPHAGLDRKSTRLNSSHVKISYAVFCL